MKNIFQTIVFSILMLACLFGAFILTGCTRTDTDSNAAGTGVVDNAVSGTTSDSASATATNVAVAGAGSQTNDEMTSSSESVSTNATSSSEAESQPVQIATGITQTGTSQTDSVSEDDTSSNNISDSYDIEKFNGSFAKADGSERIAIDLTNNSELTFRFSTSGIGGRAVISDMKAVYQGEDGYTITFTVSGDSLTVTVNGDDAENNAMNGIYNRVDNEMETILESDSDEDEEESYYGDDVGGDVYVSDAATEAVPVDEDRDE